ERVLSLRLNVMYDDGFVAYLNTSPLALANMPVPAAQVAYQTLATQAIEANNAYVSFDVPRDYIGITNTLAIEVHQASPSSSDLVFDAELVAMMIPPAD